MRLCWLIAGFLFAPIVWADGLIPTETVVRTNAVKQYKSQLVLLKKLVNINSGTSNIAGVHQVGNIVRRELRLLGFKTRWVQEPAYMRRAGTLMAERKGTKGKRLLLIGHLDTVFPQTSKFQQFKLEKNKAIGPGVIDDKGGLVVMLAALRALNAAHLLDNTTITIVLTGDEEDSGKPAAISRLPLIAAAKTSDVALDFEPSITLGTASIARRGISMWTVEAHGNESHSATIFLPEVGDGAIFELARILNTMRTEFKGEKYLSFNPGVILGGNAIKKETVFGKENVVAKIAIARGDFRFLDTEQQQAFETRMLKIVNAHLPGAHAKIVFIDGIPAMSPTENNLQLLQQYSQVSQDLIYGAVKPLNVGIRGAGDISYVAAVVPANLAGLGPTGWGTHSIRESIDLDSLPIQTARAALLMYRLTSLST